MRNFLVALARKLCSRKLWLSVVSFVSGIIIMRGGSEEQATQISGAIMSGAAVLAYCIGEGLADGNYIVDNNDKGDNNNG